MTDPAQIATSLLDYKDPNDNAELQGFLCVPPNHKWMKKIRIFAFHPNSRNPTKIPAILVCHAFGGITEFEEGRCRELAKVGKVNQMGGGGRDESSIPPKSWDSSHLPPMCTGKGSDQRTRKSVLH